MKNCCVSRVCNQAWNSFAAFGCGAEAKIPVATARETLKEVQCTVRDFTPADMATYDKIADFLAAKKITPSKVDVSKVVQKGFYAPK